MAKNPKQTNSATATVSSKVVRDGHIVTKSKTAASRALAHTTGKMLANSSVAETDKDILRANRSLTRAVRAIRNSRSQ